MGVMIAPFSLDAPYYLDALFPLATLATLLVWVYLNQIDFQLTEKIVIIQKFNLL